jgi:hypothetical protein
MARGFDRMARKKTRKTGTTRKGGYGIPLAKVMVAHDLLLVGVQPSRGLKDLPPRRPGEG